MKKYFLSIFALATLSAGVYAQDNTQCRTGTNSAYYGDFTREYVPVIWSSRSVNGTRCIEWADDASTFRYEWNLSSGGSIGRIGRSSGSFGFTPRRVSDCGPMQVTKNVTVTDNGGGDWNNMIYGYWGTSPEDFASVEYYVIDSQDNFWFGEHESIGKVTVDGGTYSCYRLDFRNDPNDFRDFVQYVALRDNQRSSGTVRLKPIFDFWISKGAPNDFVNEIAVGSENFNGGSGVWEGTGIVIPDTDTPANPNPPTDPDPEPPTEGTVTFRAQGASGNEQVEVLYNNQTVGDPITLSTSFQEYQVPVNNPTGNFKLEFINDNRNNDVVLDWLEVGNTRKEAEDQEVNTASWTPDGCGTGGFTENMFCSGFVDFGTFGGNNNSRLSLGNENRNGSRIQTENLVPDVLNSYPNPAAEALTVEGGSDYQIGLYDLTGRSVMQHRHLKGKTTLDVNHVQPGAYIMKMRDANNRETSHRVVIE